MGLNICAPAAHLDQKNAAAYNTRMARWLANNVGLMGLAILLAFAVWLVSTWQDNPIEEGVIAAPVELLGRNQRSDTILKSSVPTTVTTNIRAPRSVLNALAHGGVKVNIDISKLNEGDHIIELVPQLSQFPATLLSSSPVTAVISLERLAHADLPVRLTIRGEPALGYQILSPVIEPSHIVITAPYQIITQVNALSVTVMIDNARADSEQRVRVFALDVNGKTVDGITMQPEFVSVQVPIQQKSNYRDLAVRVRPEGRPADGYSITNVASDPQIATVLGSRDVIQNLQGYIETQNVSVDGAISDVQKEVSLNTPVGVSLLSNLTVTVKIKIEPIQGARTITRKVEISGKPTNRVVNLSPDTVDVVLSGSLPTLNSLKSEDVHVLVDLREIKDLKPGVIQLEPKVIGLPEGITSQSLQPAKVQVEIK